MSDTLCALPWKQIATSPLGTIRPCCAAAPNISFARRSDGSYCRLPVDLESSWNTAVFENMRTEMKQGKWPAICGKCRNAEAIGLPSDRLASLRAFPDLKAENLPVKTSIDQVELLDLRMGNRCNLKCRMCSPYASSAWKQDWEDLGEIVDQLDEHNKRRIESNWFDDERTWRELSKVLPNIKKIYLTGGEPLLIPMNKKIVQECIRLGRAKEIHLRYSTNGTVWDEDLVDKWREFGSVNVKFSVDGLDAVGEYIRHPSRWAHVLKNIELYRKSTENSSIEISINCAAQAYNIFHLPKLLDFFGSLGVPVFLETVRNPAYLSLAMLPKSLADLAKKNLSGHLANPLVPPLISLLDSSKSHLWEKFVTFTSRLDELRSQKLADVLPEIAGSDAWLEAAGRGGIGNDSMGIGSQP